MTQSVPQGRSMPSLLDVLPSVGHALIEKVDEAFTAIECVEDSPPEPGVMVRTVRFGLDTQCAGAPLNSFRVPEQVDVLARKRSRFQSRLHFAKGLGPEVDGLTANQDELLLAAGCQLRQQPLRVVVTECQRREPGWQITSSS